MRAKVILQTAALATVSVLSGADGFGEEIVDQQYTPSTGNFMFVGSFDTRQPPIEAAQTFVVGISGLLTSVDLPLLSIPGGGSGSVLFQLRTTDVSGFPADQILGSGTIPGSLLPPSFNDSQPFVYIHADLTKPFSVSQGQPLALVVLGGFPGAKLGRVFQGNYDLGQAYGRGGIGPEPDGPWFALNADFGFRTYVDPVPEPSIISFLLVGVTVFFLRSIRENCRARR